METHNPGIYPWGRPQSKCMGASEGDGDGDGDGDGSGFAEPSAPEMSIHASFLLERRGGNCELWDPSRAPPRTERFCISLPMRYSHHHFIIFQKLKHDLKSVVVFLGTCSRMTVKKNKAENQDGGIGRHTAPPRTTRTDRKSNSKGVQHQGNIK